MPIGIRVTELPVAAGTLDDDDEFLTLEDGSLRRATRTQAGPKAAIVQVEDAAAQFTGTNVETVLAEIQDNVDALVISGGGMAVASEAEVEAQTDLTKAVVPGRAHKLLPWVDVRRYGAVGDGTTDDTAAFLAAIAAAGEQRVVIPEGFMIGVATGAGTDPALQITAPCTLDFEPGAGLVAISGSKAVLQIASDDVTIIGGTFDGAGLPTAAGGVIDIYKDAGATALNRVHLDGCHIQGAKTADGRAVRGLNVNHFTANSVTVEDGATGFILSAAAAGNIGVNIRNCWIDVSTGTGNNNKGIGISGTGSSFTYDDVRIEGNYCKGNAADQTAVVSTDDLGIEVFESPGTVQVIGNHIEGFGFGISVTASQAAAVVGNITEDSKFHGIEVASGGNVTVSGNVVKEGDIGVSGISTTCRAVVSGNMVLDFPDQVNGNGIHIYEVEDLTLVGNHVRSLATLVNAAMNLIYIQNTPRFTVVGNTGDGGVEINFGIRFDMGAAATVADGVVVGNHIQDIVSGVGYYYANGTYRVQHWGNGFTSASGTEVLTSSATIPSPSLVSTRTYASFGQRYLELQETSGSLDPAAGAANTGRLYLKDNGSGKTQLYIRFATGAIQLIATEP